MQSETWVEASEHRDDDAIFPAEALACYEGVDIEIQEGAFVLSKPAVGALSALGGLDVLAFCRFYPLREDLPRAAQAVSQVFGCELEAATASLATGAFLERMKRDGWLRSELPRTELEPLKSIYFTVTRRCDLACHYCYQGLTNRANTDMSLEQAIIALDKIQRVNPRCIIIVTGGEPFSHPRIFDILEQIDARGFRFTILSNGTYIDEACAARLKALPHFWYIQLSMDGITEETHSLTRGRGHLKKVQHAFDSILAHGLPFVLAPTAHDGNLHELYDVAALAIEHGGWCKPNNLREFPHKGLRFDRVYLSNDRLLEALRVMNRRLIERFGLAHMSKVGSAYQGVAVCSVDTPNAKFICGMAHSLMDLDWNGEVYPCHLTKDRELIIGNLFEEDFDAIFRRVREKNIRVESPEIPKCSSCKFVSTCGGGCRAGAWFAYGSLAREDNLCSMNYESSLKRLLVGAGAR
jgi:radical SAM protein with 4Fe4S-binding SPASM domain